MKKFGTIMCSIGLALDIAIVALLIVLIAGCSSPVNSASVDVYSSAVEMGSVITTIPIADMAKLPRSRYAPTKAFAEGARSIGASLVKPDGLTFDSSKLLLTNDGFVVVDFN